MQRFEFLDALRGFAAFCVVFQHLHVVQPNSFGFPNAYLAVDFFFILSGFVLAHAYGARLDAGMGFRGYALRRIIRLYPLAGLGALIGLCVLLLKWSIRPDEVGALSDISLSGALNVMLLPNLFIGTRLHDQIFPVNGPLWTLFFELSVNLIWGAFVPMMRRW